MQRPAPLLFVAGLSFFPACFGSSSGGPPADAGFGSSSGSASFADGSTGSSSGSPMDGGSGGAAFDLTALPSGAFAYTQGSYLEGFELQAHAPIHVTALGYFDASLAGKAQTFAPTDVGLYDMTTGTMLGKTTVEATDPAMGIFRFHPLAAPVALGTTDTYAVVAVTGTNYYVSGFDYAGQLSTDLTWVGFAGYGANNLTMTTTLVQPNNFWNTTGNLGPDFLFDR